MKTIDEIISGLSPEEIEIHRELIDECKEREDAVKIIGQALQENLEKLTTISMKLYSDMEKIAVLSEKVHAAGLKTRNSIVNEPISMIPDDKFYHA